ncbi:MAG: hypothetical protein OHK0013_32150 [Sandaracinaceae bacterium]
MRDLAVLLAPYGIAPSAELSIVAEPHPCPGYRDDTLQIAFYPPVADTPVDRLRWSVFSRVMGVVDVHEAAAFYEVALPLVIGHELAHHLRLRARLASASPFVEEQVCDRVAVALLQAHPTYRATLPALRQWCECLRDRLAGHYGEHATRAFLPDMGAILEAEGVLNRQALARYDELAAACGLCVDDLLEACAAHETLATARAARQRARSRVDTRYTHDPSEYWFLSCTWLAGYLSRPTRDTLDEVVVAHLRVRSSDRSRAELLLGVRELLASGDPSHRVAGAEGLLELVGADAVADVVQAVRRAVDLREAQGLLLALCDAWRGGPEWSRAPVQRLLDEAATGALRRAPLQPLLRLAGVTEVPVPPALLGRAREAARNVEGRSTVRDAASAEDAEALRIELMVALGATDAEWRAVLQDPDRAALALDAWVAWRKPRAGLPSDSISALFEDPPPRLRAALAPLATLRDKAGSLPARGSADWTDALAELVDARCELEAVASAPTRRPVARIRAAAALSDLGMRRDLAESMARDAFRWSRVLVACAQALPPASPAAPLAAEQLTLDARRLVLDALRVLAERSAAPTVHRLAERAAVAGPLDADLVDILVESSPAKFRDDVALVLRPQRAGLDAAGATTSWLVPPELEHFVDREIVRAARLPLPLEDAVSAIVERSLHLRTVPLFAHLEPARLWQLAEQAVELELAPDDVVVREGDAGRAMFVVIRGRLSVEIHAPDGSVVALDELVSGSAFGEMALLDGEPRSATVRAVEPCRLLMLSAEALRRVGRAHPEVYEALLQALSARLRRTTKLVASLRHDESLEAER